jgi:hypothetical protein
MYMGASDPADTWLPVVYVTWYKFFDEGTTEAVAAAETNASSAKLLRKPAIGR